MHACIFLCGLLYLPFPFACWKLIDYCFTKMFNDYLGNVFWLSVIDLFRLAVYYYFFFFKKKLNSIVIIPISADDRKQCSWWWLWWSHLLSASTWNFFIAFQNFTYLYLLENYVPHLFCLFSCFRTWLIWLDLRAQKLKQLD